jgi:hypothetical protein
MNRSFWRTMLLALGLAVSSPALAGVDVHVTIPLPPPIPFFAPPELIVLPETYVYVAPDVDVDIFFYDGWWWRPWEGRWYRSQYYNSGWAYYQSVPVFYVWIPSSWRNDYRDRHWRGHAWNYQRMPHHQVERNWRGWERDRHWERQGTWGVQGLQPRTRSSQPSREMQQRQSRPSDRTVKPSERSPQPSREVQPRQSRPSQRLGKPAERSPQYKEAAPQSRKAVKQKKSRSKREQGEHEREDKERPLRR